MKILALHGSPRTQGNSSQLLNVFLDEAKSLGVNP
jgi:multimeric flavodoxin WrbA